MSIKKQTTVAAILVLLVTSVNADNYFGFGATNNADSSEITSSSERQATSFEEQLSEHDIEVRKRRLELLKFEFEQRAKDDPAFLNALIQKSKAIAQ